MNAGRLMGLFGTCRSGSTWLGAVVAAHPEVVYRFEPFHRMKSDERVRAVRAVRALIESGAFSSADLDLVYDMIAPATPEIENPPFLPRTYDTRLRTGRALLWPLARKSRAVARLFQWLYSSMDRWRSAMPVELQAEVLDIVADSPAFRDGLEHGWVSEPGVREAGTVRV